MIFCIFSELSESRLELKENLCRDTLRIVAALGVGDAHLRGLLFYHLHAALGERARRSPELYEVRTDAAIFTFLSENQKLLWVILIPKQINMINP